jgi:hypothetical protein
MINEAANLGFNRRKKNPGLTSGEADQPTIYLRKTEHEHNFICRSEHLVSIRVYHSRGKAGINTNPNGIPA